MVDWPDIEAKYDVLRLGVSSSNAISGRTTQLVKHLSQDSSRDKKAVAVLCAKASVANKLISIVEIAKRELCKDGHKVFQYSEISFDSINIKSTVSHAAQERLSKHANIDDGIAAVDDEDEAFEEMGRTEKRRDIPILTVHLCLSPVKELRTAYGEQVG